MVITDEKTGIKLGAAEGVVLPDTALVVKPSNFVLEDAAGKFAAFDISLENSGVKIQPNGKVQVSIPVSAGEKGRQSGVVDCAGHCSDRRNSRRRLCPVVVQTPQTAGDRSESVSFFVCLFLCLLYHKP